jgi:hypothetical protein
MGTWELIDTEHPNAVQVVKVGFERDWQSIYNAIAQAETRK